MIGLIGYGRFGRLTVQHLALDFEVTVFTRNTQKQEDITRAGGRPVSLAEACRQKIIVLGVPISAMQATLKTIAPLLAPGALVVDVCSVKTYPVQWMTALLPGTAEILATHPMFGPDSATASLKGHKIVLCPQRLAAPRYAKIKAWLQGKGLITIETTPDAHDRQIAVSLALTHFIGRSLATFGAAPLEIDTEGYKRLLHILEVVTNDTWELFQDMHRFNPYAKEKRAEFLQAIQKVVAGLESDQGA